MEVLSRPAEEFGNDQTLEHLWAAKAIEHSELYFNVSDSVLQKLDNQTIYKDALDIFNNHRVLCSVDTRWLRLTPHDDLIYTHFKQDFPNLDVSFIVEEELKNPTNKTKWRMFCEKFKNIVEDYSFGTLIRADVSGDYSEKNTILVARVQFYAIEIARNRDGLNNVVKKRHKCSVSNGDV